MLIDSLRFALERSGCLDEFWGKLDAAGDGTLGVAKDAPVGFAQIRLRFDVETDAPQEKLDQLLKLTERYCVVYQTIRSGPPVAITMNRA